MNLNKRLKKFPSASVLHCIAAAAHLHQQRAQLVAKGVCVGWRGEARYLEVTVGFGRVGGDDPPRIVSPVAYSFTQTKKIISPA